MSTSTAHGIHFQGQRLGGLVAWDADNNFIAVDFVSEPYPTPLLVCVFEPRCPEVGRRGGGGAGRGAGSLTLR